MGECLSFLWHCWNNLVCFVALLCLRLAGTSPQNSPQGKRVYFAISRIIGSARRKENLGSSLESDFDIESDVDEHHRTMGWCLGAFYAYCTSTKLFSFGTRLGHRNDGNFIWFASFVAGDFLALCVDAMRSPADDQQNVANKRPKTRNIYE